MRLLGQQEKGARWLGLGSRFTSQGSRVKGSGFGFGTYRQGDGMSCAIPNRDFAGDDFPLGLGYLTLRIANLCKGTVYCFRVGEV